MTAEPTQPSITCPRCKDTSYNQGDVANKFCGRCGYHADFPPMPPGARVVPPNVRVGEMRIALEKIRQSSSDGMARKLAAGALRKDDKLLEEERAVPYTEAQLKGKVRDAPSLRSPSLLLDELYD